MSRTCPTFLHAVLVATLATNCCHQRCAHGRRLRGADASRKNTKNPETNPESGAFLQMDDHDGWNYVGPKKGNQKKQPVVDTSSDDDGDNQVHDDDHGEVPDSEGLEQKLQQIDLGPDEKKEEEDKKEEKKDEKDDEEIEVFDEGKDENDGFSKEDIEEAAAVTAQIKEDFPGVPECEGEISAVSGTTEKGRPAGYLGNGRNGFAHKFRIVTKSSEGKKEEKFLAGKIFMDQGSPERLERVL
jgi:hypothetical protein